MKPSGDTGVWVYAVVGKPVFGPIYMKTYNEAEAITIATAAVSPQYEITAEDGTVIQI